MVWFPFMSKRKIAITRSLSYHSQVHTLQNRLIARILKTCTNKVVHFTCSGLLIIGSVLALRDPYLSIGILVNSHTFKTLFHYNRL